MAQHDPGEASAQEVVYKSIQAVFELLRLLLISSPSWGGGLDEGYVTESVADRD
jgi:hypothetical protein